ncbi:unnamed protein product [Rhizoctonia solani]|uniref:aspartate kinase n=1 Tax=Rhizoctonia solani TaxID=456999 RepID=A0A8H3CH87_9AGAM|nr:unnamed protein product [Rhizoctonia solani]
MALLQNPDSPNARWVIQKFGGTSVGKFAAKIAEEVVPITPFLSKRRAYITKDKVVLVCSARSGSTKALGTTNLLLQAATEALRQPALGGLNTPTRRNSMSSSGGLPWSPTPKKSALLQSPVFSRPDSPGTGLDKLAARKAGGSPPRESSPPTPTSAVSFSSTVDTIRDEHVAAAEQLIRDPDLLRELEHEIVRDCDGLRAFLGAAQLIEEISVRSRDSILGVGERLACKLVAAVLRDRGVDSEFVSLENIVPVFESEGGETQLDQSFYDSIAKAVGERLAQCGRRVPVVTAPHPFTMAQAIRARIPIRIKNVERPQGPGTVVDPDPDALEGYVPDTPNSTPSPPFQNGTTTTTTPTQNGNENGHVHSSTNQRLPTAVTIKEHIMILNVRSNRKTRSCTPSPPFQNGTLPFTTPNGNGNGHVHSTNQRLPTAVTIKEHIMILNVRSNRKTRSHGFLARVFGSLDRHGVVVDLISTSEVHVSMAIAAEPVSNSPNVVSMRLGTDIVVPAGTPKSILKVVQELHATSMCTLSLHPGMAILSLVGRQMRHSVGVAGRMFDTLAKGGVNIEMISQGASEINISCVIEGRDAVKALNLIHQGLLQVRAVGMTGKVGPWLY